MEKEKILEELKVKGKVTEFWREAQEILGREFSRNIVYLAFRDPSTPLRKRIIYLAQKKLNAA